MTISINGARISLPTGYLNRVATYSDASKYHYLEYSGSLTDPTIVGMVYMWGSGTAAADTTTSITLPLTLTGGISSLNICMTGDNNTTDRYMLEWFGTNGNPISIIAIENRGGNAFNFNWFIIGQ